MVRDMHDEFSEMMFRQFVDEEALAILSGEARARRAARADSIAPQVCNDDCRTQISLDNSLVKDAMAKDVEALKNRVFKLEAMVKQLREYVRGVEEHKFG